MLFSQLRYSGEISGVAAVETTTEKFYDGRLSGKADKE
jgi:hypothetical protein